MLLEDLLAYYNKLERPVANESEAVVLTFGLTLQQIIDVVCLAGLLRTCLTNTLHFLRTRRIRSSPPTSGLIW